MEGNVIEARVDPSELQIAEGTLKMDIFQHLRIGVNNKDVNCLCETPIDQIYYCVPCKISCCPQCSLEDHKAHLLIPKVNYELNQNKIDKTFSNLDNALNGEVLSNIENNRKALLNDVEDTYQKIVDLATKWKEQKSKEVNDIIEELDQNLKEITTKKEEVSKALLDFGQKHKKFSGLRDLNKDPHNTLFLINYDVMSLACMWSTEIGKNAQNIENNMKDFKDNEHKKNEENVQKIHDILFMENEEEKDEKKNPLIKLRKNLNDFNTNKLEDIDKRMTKVNKCIDTFKKSVLNSVNRHGDYKELVKENNLFEHRKVKGAENLFSQRKLEGTLKSEENMIPSHPIKTKDDVILDNLLLNRNFTHVLTDLYDTYFRIPTIELQSSHADLKIKEEEAEEQNSSSVKIIEGTNQVMIYDKKLKKITKKTLKLTKNPHGYTKFPFGCRGLLIGDKVYITGGKDEFKQYPNCLIYDKKTGKIKRIMDMKNPRCYHNMTFNRVFETLMVIGGEFNDTVEIFDPLTNRWQQLPELNIPRSIPLFYFDEGRGNMYVLFGMEGEYRRAKPTDTIEILDLTEIKQGWMKINYNNKARMDFKSLINMYPLNDYMVLLYGGIESRNSKRDACVYNLVKAEMDKIDNNLMEELRSEAKTNKMLSNIVSSVSKASVKELTESSKILK